MQNRRTVDGEVPPRARERTSQGSRHVFLLSLLELRVPIVAPNALKLCGNSLCAEAERIRRSGALVGEIHPIQATELALTLAPAGRDVMRSFRVVRHHLLRPCSE